jgi:hypothetical protein
MEESQNARIANFGATADVNRLKRGTRVWPIPQRLQTQIRNQRTVVHYNRVEQAGALGEGAAKTNNAQKGFVCRIGLKTHYGLRAKLKIPTSMSHPLSAYSLPN